ncbi:hypothetical protein [Burkholderia oklahomensis]|uniref:Thioesterase domain-containing protein n=1 Tax=Burkholderia oklahomensis TaxID=342113 RepID=A0AAI8FLU6_9BURK|nr:hypothetical protein [Burkholderia oklahomensis]AIO65150.1 hypothetical protein DM82_1344 [Burkholderia oklahomensis]AJX32516.1 hypothetical protein BG90_3349 [Burkholderia oklahomensis C6786]AOI42389.1 hypothetical protein WG70_22630 [Burkholderia oklahomensis EO147]AOI45954.1 hypothetical protein WI23_09255 [Burkholderia oklahomensis C6786]KUY52685.1 hypothetical protein WG70_00285 [Burkholderia oklahomensis EO147]
MARFRYSIGETRSDWVALRAVAQHDARSAIQPPNDGMSTHRLSDQAALASAFSKLFFMFAAEHDTSSLLSFTVDCRRAPEPGSTCLLAWRVEAVEPHAGLRGDVVRFSGRAWLPDGTTVLSGAARAVVHPASHVALDDDSEDEEGYRPRPASPA